MFKLGSRLKDVVSGVSGVAVGRTEWLNGCVRYGLCRGVKEDGTELEHYWVDEQQLVEEGEGVTLPRQETGGPQNDPRSPVGHS